jgi:hypothetical protein
MDEYLASIDRFIVVQFIEGVIFREEVGRLCWKLLEDAAFVVFADEGLVINVVELVVVFLRVLDLQFGDVLQCGREGAVGGDVLLEVFLVFLFVVGNRHNKDVVVNLPLADVVLLVSLLKLLHFLCTPPQFECVIILTLSRTFWGEEPLCPARQFNQNIRFGLRLSVEQIAEEDSGTTETASWLLLLFLFDL